MLSISGRSAAIGGAALSILLLGATGASADACPPAQSTSATYNCVRNDITLKFTVTVPLVAFAGQTIPVSVSGDIGPHNEGAALPADGLQAQLQLGVSGSQTGTVTATGITNTQPIALGDEILVSQGYTTLTLTSPGVVEFSLGTFSGSALGSSQTCTVVGTPPVAAITVVG